MRRESRGWHCKYCVTADQASSCYTGIGFGGRRKSAGIGRSPGVGHYGPAGAPWEIVRGLRAALCRLGLLRAGGGLACRRGGILLAPAGSIASLREPRVVGVRVNPGGPQLCAQRLGRFLRRRPHAAVAPPPSMRTRRAASEGPAKGGPLQGLKRPTPAVTRGAASLRLSPGRHSRRRSEGRPSSPPSSSPGRPESGG